MTTLNNLPSLLVDLVFPAIAMASSSSFVLVRLQWLLYLFMLKKQDFLDSTGANLFFFQNLAHISI